MTFTLIEESGARSTVEAREPIRPERTDPIRSRTILAAAHIVPVPWANNTPGQPANVDWDATLAFRRHIWSLGLGVADAMDTAQRNMGMDWWATAELIRRSGAEARAVGGTIAVGINTDQLEEERPSIDRIADAYLEQLAVAVEAGAQPVIMASRHLARVAVGEADYERVYERVLTASPGPVVLHWLGPEFDQQLTGYWGSTDVAVAMATVLRIINDHVDRIAGLKMSLLDAAKESVMRAQLPEGVLMFTGDDFNFVDLIEGDGERSSHALLGAFAAFPALASAALHKLDDGDTARFRHLLLPGQELARHVFHAPTQYYKAGVAFLSWLNGQQKAFAMVGGLQSARSLPHYSRIVELAAAAGALERPDMAEQRWTELLAVHGVRRIR